MSNICYGKPLVEFYVVSQIIREAKNNILKGALCNFLLQRQIF